MMHSMFCIEITRARPEGRCSALVFLSMAPLHEPECPGAILDFPLMQNGQSRQIMKKSLRASVLVIVLALGGLSAANAGEGNLRGSGDSWGRGWESNGRGGYRGSGDNWGSGWESDGRGGFRGTGDNWGRGWESDGRGGYRGTGDNWGSGWEANGRGGFRGTGDNWGKSFEGKFTP